MKRNVKAITALAMATMVLTACKKDAKKNVPKTAEARTQAFASVMPASTPAAFFIGDFAKMKEASDASNKAFGALIPDIKKTQEEMKKELGFDISNPESFKDIGVIPNSGVGIGISNYRALIVTYVDDQEKFSKFMTEKAGKALNIKDAKPKTEDVEGKKLNILGEDATKQIGWLFDGKMVLIATPTFDKKFAEKAGSLKDALLGFSKTDASASAASTDSFGRFSKKYGASAMTAYISIGAVLELKEIRDELVKDLDKDMPGLSKRLEEQGDYLAFAVNQDGNTSTMDFYVGLKNGGMDDVKAMAKAADFPFEGFVTEKNIALLRTSFNFDGFWASFKKNMPADAQKEMTDGLAGAGKELGIDVEADILGNLTGNLGLFFYGLDLGKAMGAMQNPAAGAQALNLALAIEFKDDKKLTKVLDATMSKAGAVAKELEGVSGSRAYDMPQNLGVLVQNKNTLFVASAVMTKKQLAEHINNKSADKKLNTALGRPYASSKPHGGLYVNFSQISKQFGPLLAAAGEAQKIINALKEASISFDSDDNGMSATLAVELGSSK